MIRSAVYPGSFDPVTNGHLDIIERTAKIFDKVYVAILENSAKKPMFSVEQRVRWIKQATKHLDNVEVDCFSGLLVNYMEQKSAHVIVKGLRAVSDFEYEFQMAHINRKLDRNTETLFMMTNNKYSYLSSSIVKEIAHHGGSLEGLVPDFLENEIYEKIRNA